MPPKLQTRKKPRGKKLDLLFIQDTTASQDPYIAASVMRCKDVCLSLRRSGQLEATDGLRLGVLAFRDHEDDDYVIKDFDGFTFNVDQVVDNLGSLVADGGEDFPEAVGSALHHAAKMAWRQDAVKVAVLITDAPPHGIGEQDDDYWDGDPAGQDPLAAARAMSKRGISLLIVACEPTLSNDFDLAHDFYRAVTKITGGLMLPLTDANILAPLIIGFAFEQVQIESLITEFGSDIVKSYQEGASVTEIAKKLQEGLSSRGQTIISADTNAKYQEPEDASSAMSVWIKAKNTAAGRDALLGVQGTTRVPKDFVLPPGVSWPTAYADIRLSNTKDLYIQYIYTERGEEKTGTLVPFQLDPKITKFVVNEPYNFCLRVGRRVVPLSRTFTRDDTWEMCRHFDG